MKLSIVIPVYNEVATIEKLLALVQAVELGVEKELIIVDDASKDGTQHVLRQVEQAHPDWKFFFHSVNQGKGAALRTGFAAATGQVVVVQDADLEYDPTDYKLMLKPILSGHADVVYGSRFLGGGPHRVVFFWHSVGNRILTLLSNMVTDLNLTDMEVCYKMFRREVLADIQIEEDRFGFEVEITCKMARARKWRVYEVPVSYYGRGYAEGKKITWRDGFSALRCVLKYGLQRGHGSKEPRQPVDTASLAAPDRFCVAAATGFGLGLSPVASGTAGALLGVPIACLMSVLNWELQALLGLALSALAIPLCHVAERVFGRKDDGRIVADEYLTFPVCVIGLPLLSHPLLLVTAFGVSRILDIVKPRPADRAQDYPGGLGIVADDFVANVYALFINHLLYRLFWA